MCACVRAYHVGIVYNSTGDQRCFDLYSLYVECADPTGCGLGSNSLAWDYQVQTQTHCDVIHTVHTHTYILLEFAILESGGYSVICTKVLK